MYELYAVLKELGSLSLDIVWFPLLIWSLCAACAYGFLKIYSDIDALYQYHSRVALVAGIPLGIAAGSAASVISGLAASSGTSTGLTFIVIQNPITVTADPAATASTVSWADPYLWLGLITSILLLVAIIRVARLAWNYMSITRFSKKLSATTVGSFDNLNSLNRELYGSMVKKTSVAYTGDVEIPFTFGWKKPVIVLPSFLESDPEKANLAIRHELMHIKYGDYLVNGFVMTMKSLFWFHPLLHLFDREIREYREISCDSEVLADETVSRKQYARLLFDLAPRNESRGHPVVSMSVTQSNLNKRISTMMNLTRKRPVLKSLIASLALLVGMTGFIACSDLQTTGVTNRDIEEAQTQLRTQSGEEQPLIVVNGDIVENDFMDRLKPKYIKSINVLKGESALNEYGSRGKNGVIQLELSVEKEIALADLRELNALPDTSEPPAAPFFVVVEDMPRLIGGLESIQSKIKYPEEAREAGIEGRVIVRFIVDEQGNVENPEVIRGIGGGADEEALRVVREAEFEPGRQRGEPVRVQYSLPIVYRLEKSNSENEEQSSADMKKYEHEPDTSHLTFENLKTDTPGVISGTFVNKNNENPLPIPGAHIVLSGTSVRTTTDSNGNFRLEGLPSGDHEFFISLDGVQLLRMVTYIR